MHILRQRLLSRRKLLWSKDPGKDIKDHMYKQAITELDNAVALIDSILLSQS